MNPQGGTATKTPPSRPTAALHAVENVALSLALSIALAVPIIEMIIRFSGGTGIRGASSLVTHTTLWIGMIGGMVAAREERLLGFAGISTFVKGPWRIGIAVFAGGMAAAVSIALADASWTFMIAEKDGGTQLGFGIATWVAQAVLPVGFAFIAARLVYHSGDRWRVRAIAAAVAIAVAIVLIGHNEWFWGAGYWFGIVGMLAAGVLGMPIFAVLAGITIVLLCAGDLPLATIPLKHYSLTTNPTLPTVPLFTLAGYFLAEGGTSKRFVRFFGAWFGWLRGGTAIVAALACAFFTTFTGASGVTILAMGGLLLPVLIASNMKERNALGLITSSGALGLLFPPSLPLILYAIIAGTVLSNLDIGFASASGIGIEQMFLGGILPGAMLVAITMIWGVLHTPKLAVGAGSRFEMREALASLWEAKWELALPVVALGALFGGFATPVEAAAITAMYAFVIECFVYRDISLRKDMVRILTECGLLVGGVLLILGIATGFTHWLVMEEVPGRVVDWATANLQSKWVFLLLLNVLLLIVGCLMDIFSATVVVVPIILPIALAFGVDPIHLGIIFLANLELGYMTPPVGMNLFLASYRFGKPLTKILQAVSGIFWWRLLGVLAITYMPWMSTWLPSLWK
ncbi:MAG TPA: TRAP transporter large permease subunit [Opitutaceae bacterium]